ncbi:MAG: ATP-dependent metallopeptidase FtsH/Yme1/Tma family protein [Oscillospiraceae bacterium]
MKPDKNRARGIGFYLLIGVIILAVIFYLTTPAEQKEYTYSEIEELFRQEQVKSFCLEGEQLHPILRTTVHARSKRRTATCSVGV